MIVPDIIRGVCKEFDVHKSDLLGNYRFGFLLKPRFALYKILHSRGMSFAQIGRWCGGRDHSTILHGVKRAEYMMERDRDYRSKIEEAINWKIELLPPENDVEQHNHHKE
jgi:chromosomal replication initiator protein